MPPCVVRRRFTRRGVVREHDERRRDLLDGFAYPPEFLKVVRLGLLDLEPWYVLRGERLRELHDGLARRYPTKRWVPFARRQDCDDVACWSRDGTPRVVVVHDFADPGWEERRNFATFWDWFRQAVEDMIEFGS